MPVIAIDGPAGSGKSTVARAVAERLGLAYLDTGAMYRALALAALRRGVDPGAEAPLARLASGLDIDVGDAVVVDGVDVTSEIRGADVNRVVSAVAAHPPVRAEMVRRQRAWADAHDGGVVEGRDIGTVVFPEAELKVYLTAAGSERARRRRAETASDRDVPAVHDVAAELARRDDLDSSRALSPLTVAEGAVVIDTTSRDVDDVVEEIVRRLPVGDPGP